MTGRGAAPPRPVPPGRKASPPGLVRRLDAFGRASLPGIAAAGLMVLAAAPAGPPGAVAAVGLPAVFFWSVHRPTAMPSPMVFALGLLQDLLGFAPLGAGVLTLLAVHGAAVRWRRPIARQSFPVVWILYCVTAGAAAALGWVLQLLLTLRVPALAPAWHLFLLSAGLYPLLAWPMARLLRVVSRAEEEAA
jgi:rod shape-determining protein MreD